MVVVVVVLVVVVEVVLVLMVMLRRRNRLQPRRDRTLGGTFIQLQLLLFSPIRYACSSCSSVHCSFFSPFCCIFFSPFPSASPALSFSVGLYWYINLIFQFQRELSRLYTTAGKQVTSACYEIQSPCIILLSLCLFSLCKGKKRDGNPPAIGGRHSPLQTTHLCTASYPSSYYIYIHLGEYLCTLPTDNIQIRVVYTV